MVQFYVEKFEFKNRTLGVLFRRKNVKLTIFRYNLQKIERGRVFQQTLINVWTI